MVRRNMFLEERNDTMHLIRNTAIMCVSLTVITGSAAAQPTTFNQLFTVPLSLPAGLRPYDVKSGDFNGDGRS